MMRKTRRAAAPKKAPVTTDTEAIYRENILDHYRQPRNFGTVANPTFARREANFSCGDDVEIQVSTGRSGKIERVLFTGRGCAVSQAAASMLTEHAVGLSLAEAAKLGLPDIIELLGIEIGPARVKCATLALKALQAGIAEYREKGRP